MQKEPSKNWGSNVINKNNWVDSKKTYKTKDGKDVIGLQIKLYNSIGNEVTFPVKGTIIDKKKPLKLRYQIWTLDGRCDILSPSKDDLILKEKE